MEQGHIGEFIKNLRRARGLTQRDLADMLGVTYQAVSKWERGVSIPDIGILQEIGKKFSVDMETLINGKTLEQKRWHLSFLISGIVLVLAMLIFVFLYFFHTHQDFSFGRITSDCEDFTLVGSMAYNQDKTAIYISDVSYCGQEDSTIYREIECNFYEEIRDRKKRIQSCGIGKDISLVDYLKDVQIHIDDYSSSCKLKDSSLYLEIQAKDSENHVRLYQIPIQLEEKCP